MTAIAGVVAERDARTEAFCRDLLDRQRGIGTQPCSIVSTPSAAFGTSLFATTEGVSRQVARSERMLLVADVRLDNRGDLLGQLGQGDHRRRQSDVEILFRMLERWGEGALNRLAGSYAIAWLDLAEQRLALARDPAGERPLCYRLDGQAIRFASLPSALANAQHEVDLGTLAERLTRPFEGDDRTSFAGVRSVRPGELVTFPHGACNKRFFWNPTPRMAAASDRIERYREALDQAVASRLGSRSPRIATQLSSGFDSNAVTATAARLIGDRGRLIAFTSAPVGGLELLTSKNRLADESAMAAQAAAYYGIEHAVVRDDRPLIERISEAHRHHQYPIANLFNIGWWTDTLHAAARHGADTILLGTMGNHTISYGGPAILPYLIKDMRLASWWREARTSVRQNRNRWRGVLMASLEPWLPNGFRDALYRKFTGIPGEAEYCFVRPHLLQSRAGRARWPAIGSLAEDRLRAIRRADPGLLFKALLAQTGVEQSDPTADSRLVEFCLSLPPEDLLRGGVYRPLAKAALADRVPREILDFKLRGYQGADWFARLRSADCLNLIEEIAASPGATELLDLDKLKLAVERRPEPQVDGYGRTFAWGRTLTSALAAGAFVAHWEKQAQVTASGASGRLLGSG